MILLNLDFRFPFQSQDSISSFRIGELRQTTNSEFRQDLLDTTYCAPIASYCYKGVFFFFPMLIKGLTNEWRRHLSTTWNNDTYLTSEKNICIFPQRHYSCLSRFEIDDLRSEHIKRHSQKPNQIVPEHDWPSKLAIMRSHHLDEKKPKTSRIIS